MQEHGPIVSHELKSLPSIQSTVAGGSSLHKQVLQAIWPSYPLPFVSKPLAVYYSCMYRDTVNSKSDLGGSKFTFAS